MPQRKQGGAMSEEVMLRVRMSLRDAHYAGNLVAGGTVMGLFGDVATELAIRHDGDEGLLRVYQNAEFLAPVYAGDFLEVVGRIVAAGNTSRRIELEARKVIARYLGAAGEAHTIEERVVEAYPEFGLQVDA